MSFEANFQRTNKSPPPKIEKKRRRGDTVNSQQQALRSPEKE
jgi:hypothetical protein